MPRLIDLCWQEGEVKIRVIFCIIEEYFFVLSKLNSPLLLLPLLPLLSLATSSPTATSPTGHAPASPSPLSGSSAVYRYSGTAAHFELLVFEAYSEYGRCPARVLVGHANVRVELLVYEFSYTSSLRP